MDILLLIYISKLISCCDPQKMWLNVIEAKLNCKPMQSVVSSSSVRDLRGVRRDLLLNLVTCVASHAGIFELIFVDLLNESLRILAPSASLPFCAWVSIRPSEYFPLNSFSVTVSVGGCMQEWFPLAGLPWIPPCYAWGIQAPVQPLRHQFQAHLLAMSLIRVQATSLTWNLTNYYMSTDRVTITSITKQHSRKH